MYTHTKSLAYTDPEKSSKVGGKEIKQEGQGYVFTCTHTHNAWQSEVGGGGGTKAPGYRMMPYSEI